MLYEKKKQRPKEFMPLLCVEIFLLLFIVWEFYYFYIDKTSEFWSLKFVDVANIFAQLATAGAFYLGFHQYHRNKRVERQAILIAECKAVIVKISGVIKEFGVDEDTSFENIKHCCVRLGGLGSDFQELFSELDENVSKGVVRMHWQSMYFNEFVYVVSKLQLGAAIKRTNIPHTHYLLSLGMANDKVKGSGVSKRLAKYCVFFEVLNSENMKRVREGFDFSDLYMFVVYFFEGKYTDDYMYGAASKLDLKYRAPLVAAIKDACQFDYKVI